MTMELEEGPERPLTERREFPSGGEEHDHWGHNRCDERDGLLYRLRQTVTSTKKVRGGKEARLGSVKRGLFGRRGDKSPRGMSNRAWQRGGGNVCRSFWDYREMTDKGECTSKEMMSYLPPENPAIEDHQKKGTKRGGNPGED